MDDTALKKNFFQHASVVLNPSKSRKKSALLSRLIEEGVITPKMAKNIKRELSDLEKN